MSQFAASDGLGEVGTETAANLQFHEWMFARKPTDDFGHQAVAILVRDSDPQSPPQGVGAQVTDGFVEQGDDPLRRGAQLFAGCG